MDYKTFYEVAGVNAYVVSHQHLSKMIDGFAVRRISDLVDVTVYTNKQQAQGLCGYLNDLANYGVQGVNSYR